MEEDVLPQIANFKLHKKKTILVSTFLAGPLAGGYLIAENFKQLGEQKNAISTWVFTALGLIVIMGSLFIPGIERVPNIIFPIVSTSIVSFLTQKYQGHKITHHEENGGLFFSVWRAVLASIISIVILVAIIFTIMLVTNQTDF